MVGCMVWGCVGGWRHRVCASLSLSLSLSHTQTHNYTHTYTHNYTCTIIHVHTITHTAYLAISAPCMEVAMRHTIMSWLPSSTPHASIHNNNNNNSNNNNNNSNNNSNSIHTNTTTTAHQHTHWRQHLLVATLVLTSAGGIATAFPADSSSILIVTSAVGVCAVSYVLPITIHLALYCGVYVGWWWWVVMGDDV